MRILLRIGLLFGVAVLVTGLVSAERLEKSKEVADETVAKGRYRNEHRFVFFAILIGLYEDGVPAEAINLIVPDPKRMVDPKNLSETNFVESCPLCKPAFDAFRTYKLRPEFYGQEKTRYSTFGFGISEQVLKGLKGPPSVRRETIRQLIDGYIVRHFERTVLRDEERTDMKLRLRDMKKDGHAALAKVRRGDQGETFKRVYASWKYCPNCAGVAPDPESVEEK